LAKGFAKEGVDVNKRKGAQVDCRLKAGGWQSTREEVTMDPKELADRLEALDVEAFASLLPLEYTHDDAPGQAKKLIIDALRFAGRHGFKKPRPSLDEAD
jgi:hypothetical protein